MGDLSKNFSSKEVGGKNISPSLIALLQEVRDLHGPLHITSGIRTREHNAAIGGVPDSAHIPRDIGDGEGEVGHAVDIACATSRQRYELLPLLWGRFARVGVGSMFIHVDTDGSKPQDVLWVYK